MNICQELYIGQEQFMMAANYDTLGNFLGLGISEKDFVKNSYVRVGFSMKKYDRHEKFFRLFNFLRRGYPEDWQEKMINEK